MQEWCGYPKRSCFSTGRMPVLTPIRHVTIGRSQSLNRTCFL